MARQVLCVLALCVAGVFAVPTSSYEKLDVKVLRERQLELLQLYYHIHEPISIPKCKEIASTWRIENNFDLYSNVTAAKVYVGMLENKWCLPRTVPFSLNEPAHVFEAMTLFHVLYSAKTYDTFYKTATYLRDVVNEGLFVYVLNVATVYRHDTQGISIPPIYEVLPSFFNNGVIMNAAQRINTHGHNYMKYFPNTYLWDDQVVIRWNDTLWPYHDENFSPVSYYTNDFTLNAYYYHLHVLFPSWLGSDVVPGLIHDRRGEIWMLVHKQLMSRYYMERLSNSMDEISDIGDVVKEGYTPGLMYPNGVPFPSRPHNYHLNDPHLVNEVEEVLEYERRIWESIEKGYIVNKVGEHIDILTDEGLDIIARLIEANLDSPNTWYYKNFINIWKKILGYSGHHHSYYVNDFVPLVVPSALDNYETAQRDPAFYMIWKRVMKLYSYWQKRMPLYKISELTFPSVSIKKVEVDKMVTYFEHTYLNLTSYLYQNDAESKGQYDDVSVLVQHPRLNHKPFNVRVHVNSEVAKKALITFFLAPVYDSKGVKIPLHLNTINWFMFDRFVYDLTVGDSVITRESTANAFTYKGSFNANDLYEKTLKGQWVPDMSEFIDKFPHHLMLPKGKVGGMPFQLVVYIQEYHVPKVPFGTGFDVKCSPGLGTGARQISDTPMGFPVDRTLYPWQAKQLPNMWFQDVLIYHKHAPEIDVPHNE